MLKIGDKNIIDLYIADQQISKAYLGSNLVFEADKPIFVDWIESTGTQWIDTGIESTSVTRFIVKGYCYEQGSSNTQLLGTYDSSSSSFFGARFYANINEAYWYCSDYSNAVRYGNPHNLSIIDATIESNTRQYGTLIDLIENTTTEFDAFTITPSTWAFTGGNLRLFGGVGNRRSPKARCDSLQLYTANGLVRDLRPCLHPKTFEACMYDTVTHKYFYNKGTGSFIPAPRFVEYLESDSTAYIDTGISGGNDNLEIDVTFMAQKYVQYGAIYGNYVDEATNMTRIIFGTNASGLYSNINCPAGSNSIINTGSSILNKVINFYQDKSKITVNGTDYTVNTRKSGTATTNNIALFNRSLTIPITRDIGLRVYDFKISESGTLLRHLKPCLRGNTPCMYDTVEGKYHMNVGTGTFGYGEIKFVDYIESDGNQFIDTGLIGNFNTKAEVKFAMNTVSVFPGVFGARQSATSRAFNIWGRMSTGYMGANISNRGGAYSNVIPSVDTEYTVSLSNNQLVVNDDIKTFTVADFTTPTTMLLFDINGGGTHTGTGSNRPLNGRVYYLKIWEKGELIQHLRPALDYNNVACMYDMVTGTYLYNQGTGEFKGGNNV